MFGCQKNFSYNYENNPVQTPNGTGYNINADISFSASTSSEENNQESGEEEKKQDEQDEDSDSDNSSDSNSSDKESIVDSNAQLMVEESGEYSSKDEVALYIHTYGHLPSNYITKSEAQNLGWDSRKGNLWKVAPGKSIGGDKFGNREGLLPKADKRQYYECDIDFEGEYRNEKRIIYSNDGLIYYTGDHYNSFTQLY
ncbi:MAG: ribonuclease [Lachnospiraceae bacterium]|nr:ribonuclease [Lachnospiraceae bacterium]